MNIDKKFLQRAFLAFTTGLFLACAARVSSASAQTVSDVAGRERALTLTQRGHRRLGEHVASSEQPDRDGKRDHRRQQRSRPGSRRARSSGGR